MDRALTELAEATVGLNSEMRWTLSEDITRRQMSPVFKRCASGDLTPEQALDVCMDCVNAKLAITMKILDDLYTRLVERLTENYGDTHFPAMLPLQEFFMGLNDSTTQWSTSDRMARAELAPVFRRCSLGKLDNNQALNIFVDNMVAKRDFTLQSIQDMVRTLAVEISSERDAVTVRVEEDDESTQPD